MAKLSEQQGRERSVCLREGLIYILESAPYSRGGLPIVFSQYWLWTFFVVEHSPHLCTQAALWLLHNFFLQLVFCWKTMSESTYTNMKLHDWWWFTQYEKNTKNINVYRVLIIIIIFPKVHIYCSKTRFVRLLQFDNAVSFKGSFPSVGWFQFFCWSHYSWAWLDCNRSLAYFRGELPLPKTRATALANNCPPASSALRLSQSQDFQKGNRQHNTHSTAQKQKKGQLSLDPTMFASTDILHMCKCAF